MTSTSDGFRQAATNTFEQLRTVFYGDTTFWKLGHAFDTIIDYFRVVDPSEASNFASYAFDQYQASGFDPQDGNACWYDDYGWWGIAALRASLCPKLFDPNTSASSSTAKFPNTAKFSIIANYCWNTMYANAPRVWDNLQLEKQQQGSTPGSTYDYMKPRFSGGVWNFYPSDFKGTIRKCPPMGAPKLASDPTCNNDPGGNLTAIQNTVTNTLYLVLAARMAAANSYDRSYQTAANAEYEFLNNWFYQVPQRDLALLRTDLAVGVLVRERVSTFDKTEGGGYPEICGYDPNLAWAGDQGLLIGGLVDLIQMPGRANSIAPVQLLRLAKQILDGVLFMANTHNHRILPYWLDPNGPDVDPGDYETGIGVYMRYLLYAYNNNTNLKTYLQDTGYPAFVFHNAQNLPDASSSPDLVGLTNKLATLVAAIAMTE